MSESKLILSGVVGSRAYGTDNEFSDIDIKGVAIEPIENVLGMSSWNGIHDSTAEKGARSGSGDIDTVIYPLRKFANLCAGGNPTVLELLYLPEYETLTLEGQTLIANRNLFMSKDVGRSYLGYMRSQRDSMTGKRNKKTNRPELIHLYGHDTKFSSHMIRLGLMGAGYMYSGTLKMPMADEQRQICLDIREAKNGWDREKVLAWSETLETTLQTLIEASAFPEHADRAQIDQLLIDIQMESW